MNSMHKTVTLTIDNREIQVERGRTILQAAQGNGIYIPTLCAHKDLTPYGGCRMCIVEVEGMRSLPTACTTPVEHGMVVRTQTAQVQATRREIMQLILSEHTSSCLICDEEEECRKYSGTIRKAGVTSGCRFCPNDGRCEFQDVVRYLEIKEINYPIYYRNLRVEKGDPFYDRDYNICILCGRCIRVCQEVRTAGTLAFSQRGHHTVVGPAFHRSHIDAGCEFCGDCISVCPTGALAEKVNKWEGRHDREQTSTCPLCGIGCQVRLQAKGDRVIGSQPLEDALVSNAQLCVKGRFCIPELVQGHRRLLRPSKSLNGTRAPITWEEAVDLAAEKLSACPPEEFGMLVSTSCSNEDLYVAQKFARAAMGSHQVDTSARLFYGAGFTAFLDLMKYRLPLSEIRNASVILCLGLDARFGRSVVGVELRKAGAKGARIFTIHPRLHSLSLMSEKWIQPAPDAVAEMLRTLAELTDKDRTDVAGLESMLQGGDQSAALDALAQILRKAKAPVILLGSEFIHYDRSEEILRAVARIAGNIGAGLMTLPAQGNLVGSVLMGAYPELLPGGLPYKDPGMRRELERAWGAALPDRLPAWNAGTLLAGKPVKLLYLVGETPPDGRTAGEFSIFQNIYPPNSGFEASLVLPATAFTESDGTLTNGEVRIQRMKPAVRPPGEALPHWQILCRIAQRMGKNGFEFRSAADVHREISSLVYGFGDFENPSRTPRLLVPEKGFAVAGEVAPPAVRRDAAFPFLLSASRPEHVYQGFLLSRWVEGARRLFAEGVVDISPADAAEAGIADGDEVVVTAESLSRTWPARIVPEQPEKALHVVLRQGEYLNPNPHPVSIRKKNV